MRGALIAQKLNRKRLKQKPVDEGDDADNDNNSSEDKSKASSSQYRGVYRNKSNKSNPWEAWIMIDGKKKSILGTYATEEEAARAYDAEGVRVGRELNFPDEL